MLNTIPAKYKIQVSKLEEWFGSTSNPLTIQDMQNKLNLKFAQLKCLTMEKMEMDQALTAFCRYKGKCTWLSVAIRWHCRKRKKAENQIKKKRRLNVI